MGERIDADYALRYAQQLGASYADLRIARRQAQRFELTDGIYFIPSCASTAGLGLRVLVNGSWGFTSMPIDGGLGRAVLRGLIKEAVELALASPNCQSRIRLAPIKDFVEGSIDCRIKQTTPYHELSPRQMKNIIRMWDAALTGPSIATRYVWIETENKSDYLAQLYRGGFREVYQNRLGCEISISTTAVGYGEVQTRSKLYAGTSGYDFPLTETITAKCRQLKTEAVKLLRAPECRGQKCDLIIMPDQFALHTHETVHGMEGDRTGPLDFESTYMGGSIMTDSSLLNSTEFSFASEHVTLLADATLPGGYGTLDFDDDGYPAGQFPLLERGLFKNFLLSRESAGELYRATKDRQFLTSAGIGCARASSYSRMPLVRMTNTVLQPGKATLEDLIAGVDHGMIVATPHSWSMYPNRQGFMFGCEIGRLIRNGKLDGMVRNPGYHGATIPFWKSISAVGCKTENYNQPDCGKGQPGQTIGTGHFTPPVLAKGVSVFNRRSFNHGMKGGQKCC